MHHDPVKTIILIAIFTSGYLFYIIRKTARRQLDLYDLFMLSTVALIPVPFAVFPDFSSWITNLTGVAFPFVVMFGILMAVLFVFIPRLSVKIHRLESESRLLLQELSLLKLTVETRKKDDVTNQGRPADPTSQ